MRTSGRRFAGWRIPSGSVAIGVGSRGIGRIGEIVATFVEALKEAGARPFVIPAMGSHGARPPRARRASWRIWG